MALAKTGLQGGRKAARMGGCHAFLAAFSLLLLSGISHPAVAAACGTTGITNALMIGGAGFLLLVALAALAYMAGEAIHEPRLTEWAKTEPFQIALSVVLMIAAIWLVQMLCTLDMWDFVKWTSQACANGPNCNNIVAQGDGAMAAAAKYLAWGARNTQMTMTAIRAQMGSYNQRATISEFTNSGGSILGAIGSSQSPYAGDYSLSGVLGSLLNLNTVFLLSVYFQYYSLLLFSSGNGMFMALLPLGFILRSVPAMRGVGGAVASLAIALYLFYPLMLAIYAVALPPVFGGYDAENGLQSCTGALGLGIFTSCTTLTSLPEVQRFELDVEGSWYDSLYRDPPEIGSIPVFFRLTVFNFLRAVFFPTAGILLIGALARELSKTFGDEIDASKLVQMI